jgi:hypothetical protein
MFSSRGVFSLMDAVWNKSRYCMNISLVKAELCVLVNCERSCSQFSEYINTKQALLKDAQGTEKYDFKNKMKLEQSQN